MNNLLDRFRYSSLRKAEAKIRLKAVGETVVVFDKEGKYVSSRTEPVAKIVFTDAEADLMRDCVITHNHPQDTPPGDSDVRSACIEQWRELRVVTRTCMYSVKPPPDGWNERFWYENIDPVRLEEEITIIAYLAETGRAEEMLPSEYQTAILHHVWTKVAQATGIAYTRSRR